MINPIYLKTSHRFAQRRKILGLSYRDMANKLGINRDTLHKFEHGKNINVKHYLIIEKFLNGKK